jgi:hypothetical protein
METLTLHQHGILTQKIPKTSKNKSHKNKWEEEQNSTLPISTDTRRFGSKDCLVIGQLAVHRSQLGLELLDLTV